MQQEECEGKSGRTSNTKRAVTKDNRGREATGSSSKEEFPPRDLHFRLHSPKRIRLAFGLSVEPQSERKKRVDLHPSSIPFSLPLLSHLPLLVQHAKFSLPYSTHSATLDSSSSHFVLSQLVMERVQVRGKQREKVKVGREGERALFFVYVFLRFGVSVSAAAVEVEAVVEVEACGVELGLGFGSRGGKFG